MRIRVAVGLAIATVVVGLVASASASAVRTTTGETLYVQQTAGGTLKKVGGEWRLVLSDPWPRTTFFADRPSRRGGSMPLDRFVSSWSRTFSGAAPNAALDIADGPPGRDVALLQLYRPRLDARRGTLSFVAKPLATSSDAALVSFVHRADRVSGHFGRASLFIDDGEEGSVLTFTVRGLPAELDEGGSVSGVGLELPQNHFVFTPAAELLDESKGLSFGSTATGIGLSCGLHEPVSTCDGTVRIQVAASPEKPLTVLFAPPAGGQGQYMASWAGGPPVNLTESNSNYTLQPAP